MGIKEKDSVFAGPSQMTMTQTNNSAKDDMQNDEVDLFCYEMLSPCDSEISQESFVDMYFDLCVRQGETYPHRLQLVAE
jgi:hypothetical protein